MHAMDLYPTTTSSVLHLDQKLPSHNDYYFALFHSCVPSHRNISMAVQKLLFCKKYQVATVEGTKRIGR
jgi:hypothetical protein